MVTTNAVNNFAPMLIYSDPFDGATTFKFDQEITLNFNEIVAAGNGNIIISNNGSDTRTIAINDSNQITFNTVPSSTFTPDLGGFNPDFSPLGAGFNDLSRNSMYYPDYGAVTIDPLTDLAVNTTYSVQIASGVITDDAGHDYEGLNDFSFTTIASNPLLIDSNPINNGSLKSDEDITLLFDEAVTAGAGNIVLSNNLDTRIIAIDDASQVIFNFDSITINPTEDLIANTIYNVQIANGAIIDAGGNAFAGISDVSFTAIDSIPILIDSNPENKSTIKTDGDIRLNFDEDVIAGNGDIIISNGSDTHTIAINDTSQVTFGKEGLDYGVTINPTDELIPNTSYSFQMANGAITDKTGHAAYAGFDDATITTTNSDPLLTFSDPLNNAIFKSHDNIQLHFDEKVVANSGNILLSNGEDSRTIAINDTSQVTFNNNMVTINPTTDLVADTTYSFQMESGIITDIAGNAFAGIDEATFATTANPLLTISNPSDDSTFFEIDEGIDLYFDEVVVADSGDISNGSDTRTTAIDDASPVQFQRIPDTFSAPPEQPIVYSTITINPTEELFPNITYGIQIENSTIENTDGHADTGIEDVTSLNLTTIESILIDPLFPIFL